MVGGTIIGGTTMENFLWGVHHCRREMLDNNVVGEMMQHETLCVTGESVAERDIRSCCEMTI